MKDHWKAVIITNVCLDLLAIRSQQHSGVAKGASGGTRPGAQALGAQQHTFCSHFKCVLSRNLDQNMLKMPIIWGKTVKIVSASGAEPPNHCLPPAAGGSAPRSRVITPAYYYNNFVEFVFSAKCIYFVQKRIKQLQQMFCLCFFLTFAPIF